MTDFQATSNAPPPSLRVMAPAKINLYLHVVGKRADGFHLLDSLVVFAGLVDTVQIQPALDLSLEIVGPFGSALSLESAKTGTENLVLRAARALAAHCGRDPAVKLTLTKVLPIASGIGGGSADAAATLKGLVRYWDLDLDADTLDGIAAGLGADVPVCLRDKPTSVQGIGNVLTPAVALPPAWLVLANPGLPVSTQQVFRNRQGGFSAPAPIDRPPQDAAQLAAMLKLRTNDLGATARSLVPAIGQVLAALETTSDCLLARMSGSGGTCFGLYATDIQAKAADQMLRDAHPTWWIASAPLLV
jgi:4-diphosphocytidyl-2-C-methyl-D-erythritol kinase